MQESNDLPEGNVAEGDPFRHHGPAFLGQLPSADGFKLVAPISVSWVVTRRCQSSCIFCCTDSHPRGGVGADLGTALNAIDALADWGVLRLIVGGGEPLLRDDIVDIVAHAASRGLSPALATNGFVLDDVMAARLAPHVMQFQISLDSVRPDEYAALRGKAGGPDLAIRAINAAADTGRIVRVVTVLNDRNMGALEEIADAVDRSPARQWFIFAVQPSGRGARSFSKLRLRDMAAARAKVTTIQRTMRTDLAVCFWGDSDEDAAAIYLDETGRIQLRDYSSNAAEIVVDTREADVVDACHDAWAAIPDKIKYATLSNFISPARRI
ncbi:MAG: radical SAM protein [Alphaproteobacteria bacterium]